MIALSEFKKVALEAVEKAEERILYYFKNQPKVETKINNTPVTKADKEAEEIIISTIRNAFPNHGFRGEEFGEENKDAEYVWIIDPIDGTKNFIHKLGYFGTVLGLQYQSKIILGISNMPAIKELLYASIEEQTTLNNQLVQVSQIDQIENAFVNFNPSNFDNEHFLNIVKTIDRKVLNMRGFGDTFGYHLVATGRADVMFEIGNNAWDISAFEIIIKQAGGKFTNFEGEESISDHNSVATNGLLHNEMLKIIKEARTDTN